VFFDHAFIAKGLGLLIKFYFYIITPLIFFIHNPKILARIPPNPLRAEFEISPKDLAEENGIYIPKIFVSIFRVRILEESEF
jgi:hypothetical protein